MTTDATTLFKGAAAGLVGGLIASWVMNQFQAAVPGTAFRKLLGEADDEDDSSEQEEDSEQESDEPATVKAAEAVSEGLLDHELQEDEKEWAGPAVHYSFGSSIATAYGVAAEVEPRVTAGAGLPFGTVFWLIADEGAVPALGLSTPPWEHPPSTHIYALASHLVFGLTAEVTRRLVRRLL